ncbi:MAG TPA: orotidine-5'-phosphate decarboxylase [Terriglobia bacterium]|nr:orotidine-5'-phosphate decarboxylase [Terriglobia bacterium]
MKDKVIIALDVSSRAQALLLVKTLHDMTGMFKVGGQLYMAAGPAIVREIVDLGAKVFLDLKFHDIPNTVKHAAMEAAKLGASMITVHTAGGRAMIETTIRELHDQFGAKRPAVIAVTVLTSLDTRALFEIGMEQPVDEHVQRLGLLAQDCGADGGVCSAREIQGLRKVVKPAFKIVAPGIRMPDQSLNDQQRIATPHDAIAAGADYIVVGRAVTDERDPRAALERLIQSI